MRLLIMKEFKKLKIWQRSFDFAEAVYGVTDNFPKREMYSLVDKIRRAAVSVFSNIAEGCRRSTDKDLVRFLYNALGSLGELESQLLFAGRVNYLETIDLEKLISEIREINKMIVGYIKFVCDKDEEKV